MRLVGETPYSVSDSRTHLLDRSQVKTGWRSGSLLVFLHCDPGSIPAGAKVAREFGCRSILVLAGFLQALLFPIYLSILAPCPIGRWLYKQIQLICSCLLHSYMPHGRYHQQQYHLPNSFFCFLLCLKSKIISTNLSFTHRRHPFYFMHMHYWD